MCGIYGIVSFNNNPINIEQFNRIGNSLIHRGPDSQGSFLEPNVCIGHNRLSIIDLSEKGKQPMVSSDGNLVIAFNGEIYNFQELKDKLIKLDVHFMSLTDTEVILNAFSVWGTESFDMLNGIFSFVIFDKRSNTLYFVRDYAGIKPLYYFISNNVLIFSSEIRGFRAYDVNWPSNDEWPIYFLSYGFIPFEFTTLRNVHSLKKGCYLSVDLSSGVNKIHEYKVFRYTNSITDEKEALRKVRYTLQNSVSRNMISDAPLGIFLSGGIDSSLIALIADSLKPKNLITLSITFEEANFTEESFQEIVLRRMKPHQHLQVEITGQNFIEKIDDIFESMDQPTCDGINSYFISEAAHKMGLKAVLSGLGADELFGGYPSFNRINWLKALHKVPSPILKSFDNFQNEKVARLAYFGLESNIKDYLFFRGIFSPKNVATLTGIQESTVINILNVFKFNEYPTIYDKNLASFLESNIYMQYQLLKDTDYMSMWHSLEVRVPFLDKELISLMHLISPDIKYNSDQKKYLLKKAFEDILPTPILNRKKQGFTFPFDIWFRENINIFKPMLPKTKAIQKMLHNFELGNLHWSRLWMLIVFNRFQNQV